MMLAFAVVILPGVLFAYAAEWLMKRKLNTHSFLFLAAFNVLSMNLIALALDMVPEIFLSAEGYNLAIRNMDYATALVKYIVFTALPGIPLCLAEAFLGRFLSISLDDTKKDEENKNA